jgi:predicted component of type VI protein secretion system
MRTIKRWIVLGLILASLLLSACSQAAASSAKVEPAKAEEIEGSELKRVTLTEKAAERIDLQTATVREVQVELNQTVVGEIVDKKGDAVANPDQLWVRAPFKEADLQMVALDQPVRVLSLTDDEEDSDDEGNAWTAEPDEALGLDDDEESSNTNVSTDTALYYLVNRTSTSLLPGQRVFVEVPLSKNGMVGKVIPYAALIYDVEGGTWVYVKEPNALTFMRQSVTVDHIQGDLAFLTDGPEVGSEVVTVGGAELFGVETGVSK